MSKKEMGPVIGIDLGTTYSCVGFYRNGQVEIIANDQGNKTTPSYVAFDGEERMIGEAAKNQASSNPTNTVFDAKRLIGRTFSDKGMQSCLKHFPFKVVDGGKDNPIIEVQYMNETKRFNPEEISSMILLKMKQTAESFLGEEVRNAVITVPAYFNDSQRQATKDAGVIAGLNVLRIINEPTAAAIAYGLGKKNEKNVLIFDFGGGTLDVSVLETDCNAFEVRAVSGNSYLGGEDLDNRLVTFCLQEFCKKTKLSKDETSDLLNNARAKRRLRTECERCKKTLSSSTISNINLDSFFNGIDMSLQISRAKFEEICKEELDKCIEPINEALKIAKISKSQIDDIVLVGGSTRIPKIQKMLEDYFQKPPKKDINPDEAIAYGAAVQGFILSGQKDETTKDLVLIDVTPLSLGIETAGKMMSILIPRGHTIPCSKEEIYSTFSDNQPAVTINVFEGERAETKNNHLLGSFDLTGIPPMPRGMPKIKVKFDVDANSILQVTASEESSGKSHKITITNENGRMSKEEIEKKVKEAEQYAEVDKKIKDTIDAKNSFENYIYSVRNTLNDSKTTDNIKQKLGEEKFKELSDKVTTYSQWLDDNSSATKEEFEEKRSEAEKDFMAAFKSLYESSDTQPNNSDIPEFKNESGPRVDEVD